MEQRLFHWDVELAWWFSLVVLDHAWHTACCASDDAPAVTLSVRGRSARSLERHRPHLACWHRASGGR